MDIDTKFKLLISTIAIGLIIGVGLFAIAISSIINNVAAYFHSYNF